MSESISDVQWNRDSLSSVEGKTFKRKASTRASDVERSAEEAHALQPFNERTPTPDHVFVEPSLPPYNPMEVSRPTPRRPSSIPNPLADSTAEIAPFDVLTTSEAMDDAQEGLIDHQMMHLDSQIVQPENLMNFMENLQFNPMKPPGSVQKVVFDISDLVGQIKNILNEFVPPMHDPQYRSMNKLQRMEWALQDHRGDQKSENLHFISNVALNEMMPFWENQMTRVATWMMHCDEFRSLPLTEKFAVFKLVWVLWQRIERITATVEIFGERMIDERIIIVSPDHAVRMDYFEVDLTSITDYSMDNIKKMFEPFVHRMFNDVARPLYEISPSLVEVAYMLCQIAWHITGKNLQESTIEAGDKFRDEIANHLHEYYVNELNMPNYASRLIKIMTIVNAMQKIHLDRQKIVELARIFDVFKVDISEPDIFDC